MPKIIQIAIESSPDSGTEGNIYGLDDNGQIYVWGRKKVEPWNGLNDDQKYIYGWNRMIDKINDLENANPQS